jgi:hypothetical protein
VNPTAKATGIIRGRITAADTGRPLRRAQVTLSTADIGQPRRTNTSLDGLYEFKDLAPGRYTVSVNRSGYLSLRFGQRRPLEQAAPIQLGEGQALNDVNVVLPRAGVIAGRVLDDAGEPIAGVRVEALRPAWVEGRRQLVLVTGIGFEGTDDTGQFRLADLPPGRYYIKAYTRETWTVTASGKRELMGFAPTFHPNTTSATEARLVEVGVGQRVTIADIPLIPGRPANISGLAVDSKGQPLAGRSVGLQQRFLRETAGGGGSSAGSAPIAPDGSFSFRNVTPGEYMLILLNGNLVSGGEVAQQLVVIDGVDLSGIRLTTSAGWSASGRFVTDEGMVPPFNRDATRVGAITIAHAAYAGAGASEIKDDWTFAVRSILGAARLSLTVPDGWMVKGVRQKDRDITAAVLEMKSGEALSDIDVIVTNRVTRVMGQLVDGRGAPLRSGTVVAFSEDAAPWGSGSAFVRTGRPDQDGRYEIKGLPAGDYLVVALDYVQEGIWNDPEFLESMRRHAQRVTVMEGGAQTVALRLAEP